MALAPLAGSLYSGIGGADLGLQRAGFSIVWQAESDPYRRRVLERAFPAAVQFYDVANVDADSAAADLVYAELPTPHPGWLKEIARVVEALRPAAVVIEAKPDWAEAASAALGLAGYRGCLLQVAYKLERGPVRYARLRGFAIGACAQAMGHATRPFWSWPAAQLVCAGAPTLEVDPAHPAPDVAEFFESLLGLPRGWTCTCREAVCYETVGRATAANDATAPAIAEQVARIVARVFEDVWPGRFAFAPEQGIDVVGEERMEVGHGDT